MKLEQSALTEQSKLTPDILNPEGIKTEIKFDKHLDQRISEPLESWLATEVRDENDRILFPVVGSTVKIRSRFILVGSLVIAPMLPNQ